METKRFYAIGDAVYVRRADADGNEHNEFVAEARNAQYASDIADALNGEPITAN